MRVSRIPALLITAMMIPAISGCTTTVSMRFCVTLFISVPVADTLYVPSVRSFLSARRSAAFSCDPDFARKIENDIAGIPAAHEQMFAKAKSDGIEIHGFAVRINADGTCPLVVSPGMMPFINQAANHRLRHYTLTVRIVSPSTAYLALNPPSRPFPFILY